MKTTLSVNGEARKCIQKFEREHAAMLPPLLLGYVHPKKPWHKLTNAIVTWVFQLRVKLWARQVLREGKKSLNRAENDTIPPSL